MKKKELKRNERNNKRQLKLESKLLSEKRRRESKEKLNKPD